MRNSSDAPRRLPLGILPTLALGALLLVAAQATRPYDIDWTYCNCSVADPAYAERFQCEIVELPKRRGNYLEAELRLRRDVHTLFLHFRVSMAQPVGGSYDLVNVATDGCRLMDFNPKSVPIVKAVIRKLLQIGNVPKKCPLPANQTFSVSRFTLNPDHFPPYLPDANFTLEMVIRVAERAPPMVGVELGAAIVRKGQRSRRARALVAAVTPGRGQRPAESESSK